MNKLKTIYVVAPEKRVNSFALSGGSLLTVFLWFTHFQKRIALNPLSLTCFRQRILLQSRDSQNKVYSVFEPHVYRVSKGKSSKKYEFGSNEHDSKTIGPTLANMKELTDGMPSYTIADKGIIGDVINPKLAVMGWNLKKLMKELLFALKNLGLRLKILLKFQSPRSFILAKT